MRAARIAFALIALAAPRARADVRPASVANLRLDPARPGRVVAGTTFGLVVSDDGGATTRWICEDAIGIGGGFDPDLALHPTRDEIWAGTYRGLRVTRDGGCTWTPIEVPGLPSVWISEVEIGDDGRVWAATSSGNSTNDVFVSTDGERFVSAGLFERTGWWESLKIAPSDPAVIFVSGYRSRPVQDGYLKRSGDGGKTWTDVPETGLAFGMDPRLMVLGVSPVDPDVVFVRVLNAQEPLGDAVYRSSDGGARWTKVLQLGHPLRGFAIAPDGKTVYAGTGKSCVDREPGAKATAAGGCLYVSNAGGAADSWQPAAGRPRLGPDNTPATSNALAIDRDGALWTGGSADRDGWLIGRSTDRAASFAPVVRLSEIDAPLACPAATAQATCAARWPSFCARNGICQGPPPRRPPPTATPAPAAAPVAPESTGGCCAVAPSAPEAAADALLVLVVGALLSRRRRRA